MTSTSMNKHLVMLILQFLDEEKFKDTIHNLERESGFYFNMEYFDKCIENGKWEEMEKYLSGFTKVDDNPHSRKTFFLIRKQKYLEALDRPDRGNALEILNKDLKVVSTSHPDLFNEMALLLTLQNFRENEKLSSYGDTNSSRAVLLTELKEMIEGNQIFRDKLQFPTLMNSQLRNLIDQSFFCCNIYLGPPWMRHNNPTPNPDINPLVTDPNDAQAPSSVANPLAGFMPEMAIGANIPAPACRTTSIGGWMAPAASVEDRNAPVTAIATLKGDSRSLFHMKSRDFDEIEEAKIWKPIEISEPSLLQSLRLPDNVPPVKIVRLTYTNSGEAIVALAYNAVHKLWKWQPNEQQKTGKATASVPPQLWQPSSGSGILMRNYISGINVEEAVPCFALSKNDDYMMSASGGKISLFDLKTFKTMSTCMPPPPASTYLAFHPRDNGVIVIGMDDSSILIYDVNTNKVKRKLKGHKKRVTGLAFSNVLNVLVSSGADAKLCVWSTDGWKKTTSKSLQIRSGRVRDPLAETRVQFDQDQIHVLAVHETQIAIYEATKLERSKQWISPGSTARIMDTTYSCDSQLIYASFEDGSICIFLNASTLRLRCRINPTAYLLSNLSSRVHPLVIAAHPSVRTQFAVGLTDGGVHVLEPLESEGQCSNAPLQENN